MVRTSRNLAAYCALLLIAAAGYGQTPTRLANESEGYSFAVPRGFTGQASGEGFALVNPAKTILIVVNSHGYRDFAAFAADANLERDGLQLVGKPQAITGGAAFRTVKRTDQGLAVIDTAVVFNSSGGGVAVIAMTSEANAEASFSAGLAVAQSVRFEQPKFTASDDRVRRVLAGKSLLYLYTGNGYSERKDILLCSSGRFYQSTGTSGFTTNDVDGPSFAATGGNTGTWSIMGGGTRLVLRFADGGTSTYTLSARQASNEIGLNGRRYFVQSQSRCP